MPYTKKLEVKIDGTKLLWEIDPETKDYKIKDTQGFEMTVGQLNGINTLLTTMVNVCNACPDVISLEYSNIE